MRKTETLKDWLARAASSKEKVVAIHFDGLNEDESSQLSGLNLVHYAHDLLVSVIGFLRNLTYAHGIKNVVVFLPVRVSDDLLRWHLNTWNTLECIDESPTLYLLRDSQVFDEESEEYRRPIPLPFEDHGPLIGVFRSFRNQDAIANSWEFTSGIYLIFPLE